MNRISTFFAEMYNELMHKVSWPTWEELQSSLVVVATASLILAFIVWVMNEVSNLSMSTFYHLF